MTVPETAMPETLPDDNALADLTLGARPAGRTALTASWVLGHAGGQHRLIRNGEVVIDSKRVVVTKGWAMVMPL